jgi:hypothetical protein
LTTVGAFGPRISTNREGVGRLVQLDGELVGCGDLASGQG